MSKWKQSKKQKIYYKVVTSGLTSVCDRFYTKEWKDMAIQYKIGEFVKSPHGMSLFVFGNLEDATSFNEGNKFIPKYSYERNFHIYKCEIIGKCRLRPLTHSLCVLKQIKELIITKQSIEKLLKLYRHSEWYIQSPPVGTVAVKQVKLLEKVC